MYYCPTFLHNHIGIIRSGPLQQIQAGTNLDDGKFRGVQLMINTTHVQLSTPNCTSGNNCTAVRQIGDSDFLEMLTSSILFIGGMDDAFAVLRNFPGQVEILLSHYIFFLLPYFH